MEIKNNKIESFLKSFTFSFLLFLFWGCFSLIHIQALLKGFDFTELLWLIYNVIISVLFLIRVKPAVVSMNLIHWVVALITSFSGFFFFRVDANGDSLLSLTADTLIVFAVFLGIVTALMLGRSYDFLPALRYVKTRFVYQFVRHPMYLSSIIIKLGYVLKNPSVYNFLLLIVVIVLYDKRAKYEEEIMSHNNSYVEYLQQVKYRFIPRVY
jgi:protein-S-isoprenylcysteine O-methyltransferase Ste14